MKILLCFLMLTPFVASADEICGDKDWQVLNPDARWHQDDFTRKSAESALSELSDSLKSKKEVNIFRMADLQSVITGYILLKNVRIAKMGSDSKRRALQEFCSFLTTTPVRENS